VPPPRLLRSVTFRLALVYAGLFAASAVLLLGFVYWQTAAYLFRQADDAIEAEVATLAERYRRTGIAGLTGALLERVARRPAGSSVYLLVDERRHPLVGNLSQWPPGAESPEGWLDFRLEDSGWPTAQAHLARARVFHLPGGYRLLVGRDLQELTAIGGLITRALGWGLPVTAVLAFLGAALMSRSTTRRVEAVNQTARQIMAGDLSRRVPARGAGDEFDELAVNLNAMLDRIEALMEDVRRVSDSIAHDLRTPLSRLRGRLEQLRGAAERGSADPEAVEQAVADADGLLATFNALLRIARAESPALRAEFVDVDLPELVRDVAELYEPVAEERGLRMEVEAPGAARTRGDRDLLFQAFANLLDNAVKYTPAGGTVRVSVAGKPGRPAVVVADTGPGVPEAERQKVFQRFYRLDGARSTPGNGLGLSLVDAVARLHGAQVALEDNGPGLRVRLSFPGSASSD
jgi:signal transduction histidine kinase